MMHLLNSIRCWFYGVKLRLIEMEILDTMDDMRQALDESNIGVYRGLSEFHTELVLEAQLLRANIQSLTTH